MGYTHYWKFKQSPKDIKGGDKKFKKAVELFKKCISIHPFPLAGGDGTGEPTIKDNKVCFNGVGDNSYETCYFALDNENYDFDFCKTARLPYDGAVCLAILCLKNHLAKISHIRQTEIQKTRVGDLQMKCSANVKIRRNHKLH